MTGECGKAEKNMNQQAYQWGAQPSTIRALAMYARERAAEIGAENVCDFTIGNPSVPAPDSVREAAIRLLSGDAVALHGYSSSQGDLSVRTALCNDLNRRYAAGVAAENMYLTCGAAAALCCLFHGMLEVGDEVLTIAPFFPEYSVFPALAGGALVPVAANPADFQPDFDALEQAFSQKTRALLINSPNNPTGVVYTTQTLKRLGELLRRKSAELGRPIYFISDEPYRELVFEGEPAPWVPHFYDNTLVCYSFSKSLSLPGERIGYFLVPPTVADWERVYLACCGAGRALGYVCAPTLFQQTVVHCLDERRHLGQYAENLALLAPALREMGYEVPASSGAFYLFVKAPEGDGTAFSERAKAHDLLVVPSDSFGVQGYVRVSYCVARETVEAALPRFAALMKEFGEAGRGAGI